MKTHCFYLTLEGKRFFTYFYKFILTLLFLALLGTAFVFLGTKLLYETSSVGKIPVAVVVSDHSESMELGWQFFSGSDSMKELCVFTQTDQKTAETMLKEHKVLAILDLPSDFTENIIRGTNKPLAVQLSKDPSIETTLLKELLSTAANTLGSAQAIIYAMDSLYGTHSMNVSKEDAFAYLNQSALTMAFGRTTLFDEETLSASGNLSAAQYYGISALLMLLLLSGLCFPEFLTGNIEVLSSQLKRKRISPSFCLLCRFFIVFVFYVIFLTILLMIGHLSALLPKTALLTQALCVVTCAFFLSSFFCLLFSLSKQSMNSMLLLFLISMGILFLSGSFLPLTMLGNGISHIAPYLPGDPLRSIFTDLLQYSFSGNAYQTLWYWNIGLFCTTFLLRRCRS